VSAETPPLSKAAAIVAAVLRDLEGRKGFDWWWHDIDEDIREEIRAELIVAVRREMEA